MEIAGMRTEREFLDEFGKELKEKIETLELAIYDYAGERFKVNSPFQLGDILFEKLQLPSGKKRSVATARAQIYWKKLRTNTRLFLQFWNTETLQNSIQLM